MKIESTSYIDHPRDRVYEAYRDQLPEVARFIPDVASIRVASRDELDGGVVKLHNVWKSDRDVPRAARAVIKPEHLEWDDHATWHDDAYYCDWQIKTRVFEDAVDCRGKTILHERGEGTRVELVGELQISLDSVPGVPGFVGRRLAPKLESFIVDLITPNLERTNDAVGAFLDEQG